MADGIRFRTWPWQCVLQPVLFVWHKVNEYDALIPGTYYWPAILYYILFAFFLWGLGMLFYRKSSAASVWATLLLVMFFYWGSTHDGLRGITTGFFASWVFMGSLAGIVLISVSVLIWRKRDKLIRMQRYIHLLLIVLLFLELISSAGKGFMQRVDRGKLATSYIPTPQPLRSIDSLPDIYFIIFDEYASSKSIAGVTGYDNTGLDTALVRNGFFVAPDAMSAYNNTPVSIASTLNLEFFPELHGEGIEADSRTILRAQNSIRDNFFTKILISHKYNIVNLGLIDLPEHPATPTSFFNGHIIEILFQETLAGRVQKELFWHFGKGASFNFTLMKQMTGFMNSPERNVVTCKRFIEELKRPGSRPTFVWAHVMMPHSPFFYDRHGNFRAQAWTDPLSMQDSLYVEQVQFCNTFIRQMAEGIQRPSNRPAILVIQGDHGYRDELNDPLTRARQFETLNAVYFSDKNYSGMNDRLSPVNTFRHIVTKYFDDAHLPLRDTTVRFK